MAERPAELPSSEELIKRLEGVSETLKSAAGASQQFEMFRKAKDEAGERAFRDRVFAALRGRFGKHRKDGARRMGGIATEL